MEWNKIKPGDSDCEKIEGTLILRWKTLALFNYPLSGVGEYIPSGKLSDNGQTVYYVAYDLKSDNGPQDKLTYVLYTLSDKSLNDVEVEHQRFIQEVGTINDYGKTFSTKMVGDESSKNQLRFKHNIKQAELEVKIVGKIKYSQIA